MKKRILSLAVALVMVVIALPMFSVTAQAAEAWRDAYANLLRNPKTFEEEGFPNSERFGFVLHDFDNNGIPELILSIPAHGNTGRPYSVYTFANNQVLLLVEGISGWNLHQSDNIAFTGLFVDSGRWPDWDWYYYEVVGGALQKTHIVDIIEDVDSAQPVQNFTQGRIADEWQRLNATGWDNRGLNYHSINAVNIATHLTSASANANRHPFATALQEFLKDATGETGAYLINLHGAGEAVYAWKSNDRDDGVNTIFWLHNGELQSTTVTGWGAGSFYMVTSSGRLATADGMWAGYSWIENGQLVHGEDIDIHDWTDREDELMTRYSGHTDDTARILAMTADIPTTPVPMQNNTITVTINGQRVDFTDQQPTIIDGRTLVPVRGVFEELGFKVSWNAQAQQVTLSRAGDTIIITVGSATFAANGASRTLDVPAQIIGGRTMIPLRAVLEAVGYNLNWNKNSRTVMITAN